MRGAPATGSGDHVARSVTDDRLAVRGDGRVARPVTTIDDEPRDTPIEDGMLIVAIVAGAWFAIGAGVALMLAGHGAAIVDVATALGVAVAGTLCTLVLLARVAADDD